MDRLPLQNGWYAKDKFVLGKKIITSAGEIPMAVSSCFEPETLAALKPIGSLEEEIARTKKIDGNNPAILIHAAALAAPLLRWAGIDGFMLSVVGGVGTGKTASVGLSNAIYGNPYALPLSHSHSKKEIFARASDMNMLPITIEGLDIETNKATVDIVSGITGGVLDVDKPNKTIKSILLTTSHESLFYKRTQPLMRFYNRFLEIDLDEAHADKIKEIYLTLHKNYGNMAIPYLSYIIQYKEKVEIVIKNKIKKTENLFDPKFRNLSIFLCCCRTAVEIARKCGLVKYGINEPFDYARRMADQYIENVKKMN